MPALSSEAVNLARTRIAVEFAARRDAFGHEVRRVQEEFSSRSMLYSGMYVHAARDLIKQEYQARASIAWTIISRVINAAGVPASPDLAQQAKTEIEFALETCSDLRQADDQAQKLGRIGQTLDHFDLKHIAIARAHSDVDMAIFAAGHAPQPAAGSGVTIINPVGVIQTGPGASATLHQTIGVEDRAALAKALAAVRDGLKETEEVPASLRDQITQVVGDAEHEIAAEHPNMIRVQGTLSALATTIQTMGSLRAAYELLKGGAAMLGIYLP